MLRAEGVRVCVPGRLLVSALNLEILPGERWGVLGRNGAGKSTLLHCLAGLRMPESGRVFLHGAPIGSLSRRAVARSIGVLLQEETRDYWGSTRDYTLLGRYPHARSVFGPSREDHALVEAALGVMDLAVLGNRAYRSLSGGERQRARLASLFAQQPALYLCDEPLQHLDLRHQVTALDQLSARALAESACCVLVLHDLVFASRYCDRLLLLFADGRHALGPRDEVLTAANLEALYGFPVAMREIDGERVFLPARSRYQPRV